MNNNLYRFCAGKYHELYYFNENNICKGDYKRFAFVVALRRDILIPDIRLSLNVKEQQINGASMMNGTSVSRLRIILTWWETLTVMSDGREEKY